MPFTLSQKDSPYHHWEYLSLDTGDSLRIVPERGGLITSWICNGRELLYFDQLRFQDQSKSVRGGIPILFPICGQLPGNQIFFYKNKYILKQHGFARDSSWELNMHDESSGIKLSLSETNTSFLSYPFKFNLEIHLRLQTNSLDILVRVKNNSSYVMPFSFGLHPYFSIKDLNQVEIKEFPEECINQKTMAKSKSIDALKRIPNGIDLIAGPNHLVQLIDLVDKISLEMTTQEPFGLNVIWTDPPRKMVCLEPWTSPRNALINGNRSIHLGSGQTKDLQCRFELNKSY
ncbi:MULTISPECIES: galactose mutarotase [unclassified Prochlorococcus]|uniref:aldose epimerase family protein n=1 Tax=unclassified Prochlorococcus TaxID=2627481 RepID=UPI000533772B|nr:MULTISPECIES: galactose mutarotase [unclassified Prochlorococcus]KGG14631.1 Galactose mutarotase [Prochlorococcus sp. MIT 0602]KGG15940.1 Galactose mutarotase [Prochlorococcus sp. MIT 0603]